MYQHSQSDVLPGDLFGAVAIVTGASSGIGRAVALELGAAGAEVIAIARREEKLASLVEEIRSRGGRAEAMSVDIRHESGLVAAFEIVARKYRRLDILVNAAGLGRVAPLVDPASDALRDMWEVNVHALCVATREALRAMRPQNKGHIVHVSSMSGYRVQCGSGFYAATKHAVRAVTEGLRQELRSEGSKVRVSSVSPGDTASEFLEAMYGSAEHAASIRPTYDSMRSEDVARAVLYALTVPGNVEIHDILMRPIGQPD